MKRKNELQTQIKRAPSVRLYVFTAFIFFTVVTLLLLWLFQVVFLERIYKSYCITQIKNDGETLAKIIYSGADIDEIKEKATEIADAHSMCISLLVPDQNSITRLTDTIYNDCNLYYLSYNECMVLYKYSLQGGKAQLMSVSYDEEKGYVGTEFSLVSSDDEIHSVIYTLVCSASGENDLTRVLFLNSVITPVGATTQTITFLLAVISVVLVLFAFLLTVFVSRKVTRPIIQISSKAQLFAHGDYDVRFNVKRGYKEVNELSAILNYTGAELSKVEKLRRELISNISHDLRTPLTLIQGYSEMMRDIPGECNPENLGTVIDETARLTSIVNEMLDYSKIQSGNYAPDFQKTDISQTVKSTVETYRTLTEKNGYIINYDECESVYIMGDSGMIVRALLNLINNAVTHTGSDNTISVKQIISDKSVRIEVSDSGHGIPQDQLGLIWERYYKADTEHKRAAVGTGLGLSIVKSIMILHKGKFGVRSREGHGSTFWIEFDRITQ